MAKLQIAAQKNGAVFPPVDDCQRSLALPAAIFKCHTQENSMYLDNLVSGSSKKGAEWMMFGVPIQNTIL